MKKFKLILRLLVLPIITIPVIVLGWLTFTIAGLSVIAGLLGVLFFPLCWITEHGKGMELCRESMATAAAGIAYPFVLLWYFVFDTDELERVLDFG